MSENSGNEFGVECGCTSFECRCSVDRLRAEVEALKTKLVDSEVALQRRKSDWEIASRVADNYKAQLENAVRIGCENITAREKAEAHSLSMVECYEHENKRAVKAEAENAELKASCMKHVGHEHCVTPCDSIRIQEENHNSFLLMKERAEKAENKLSECRCWKEEHCPLHSVGIATAEAKALALALECKEKTEAVSRFVKNHKTATAFGPRGYQGFPEKDCECYACISGREALSRPASFWTRKAEAMEGVIESARNWVKYHPAEEGECGNSDSNWLRRLVSSLDSISENK